MFTVIIPLYQKEPFIARAIDSVLAQTYGDFELIVVDDGSKDNGPAIVQQYNDKRIRLIKQMNQGVSAARNKGIVEAKLEYLALLDADDKWEPDFLSEMKRLIDTYPRCGWYSCAWTTISNNGKEVASKSVLHEGVITDYFKAALESDIINSSSVVLPRSILLEVGGFPEDIRHREDLITWIRIASKYPVCVTNKRLSWYFCNEYDTLHRLKRSEPDLYYMFLESGNHFRNEFLAFAAIHKGILDSIYGDRQIAKLIESRYSFTQLHREMFLKLRFYNRIPQTLLLLYFNALRFLVVGKRRLMPFIQSFTK